MSSPLVDDFSGHSDRFHSRDFLPELGPNLNDTIVATNDSSHAVQVRAYSGDKATLWYPRVALLDTGKIHIFTLISAWKRGSVRYR